MGYFRTVNYARLQENFVMPFMQVAKLSEKAPEGAPYEIDVLPAYCSTDVYVVFKQDSDKADLLAWITQDCLDMLKGPSKDVLKSWMLSLDPTSFHPDPRVTLPPCSINDAVFSV